MGYTTNDIKTIYGIAQETVRNWTREFARYLSATANPETGRVRLFTDDDMKVFDLVNRMRQDNKAYEEIHVALIAGQRGNLPAVSPEDVRAIITGETERRLTLEVQLLRRQLATAEDKLAELDEAKTHNVRLEAEKEAERRRADELAARLDDAQSKLESLFREVGKAYHEGYMAALKDHDREEDD
ncbi:MAG: MerR family transcriptional regulator [Anaerolineaceae bacterium]|nr:MerR family transcriptional regulator [Anaerolineaceae bacterium]